MHSEKSCIYNLNTSDFNTTKKSEIVSYFRIFVLILILFTLLSCDIFSPREAEDPLNTEFQWHDYATTTNELLDNLEWAFEYIQNAENYNQLFSNQYIFYFDSQDVSEHGFESTWSLNQEVNIIKNYYFQSNDNSTVEVELTPNDEADQVNANAAHIYRNYVITTDDNIDNFPNTFEGKFELYLIFENGVWKIASWKDFRSDSSDTWGRFKHEFSS